MEEIRFAIIVPVYNREKYITECIESVVRQGYPWYELILVDDGSDDLSSHICMEYAGANPNITYIRKENGGPASALNVGLGKVFGGGVDYILFLDSDDRLCENVLCELDKVIRKKKSDIHFMTFVSVDALNETSTPHPVRFDERIMNDGTHFEQIDHLCDCYSWFFPMWRCAFRREFLAENNMMQVDEDLYGVYDVDYVFKAVLSSRTLGMASIFFCYYTTNNQDSITVIRSIRTIASRIDVAVKWFHYFFNEYQSSGDESARCIARGWAKWFCSYIVVAGSVSPEDRESLRKAIENNRHILKQAYGRKCAVIKILYRLLGYNMAAVLAYKIGCLRRTLRMRLLKN